MGILTNEAVGETYMVPDFQSLEEVRKLFEVLKRLSFDKDHFVYGICLEDRLIGFLNDVEIREGQIELGFVIDPAHWNKGFATEAFGEAIQTLFQLGYTRVITGAFAQNIASIRVMEKCAMTRLEQTDALEYRGKTHQCVWFEKSH